MFANSTFLRPLGIAAGVLGSFQAITWGILSLLGILVYTEVIDGKSSDIPLILFLDFLIFAYFNRTVRNPIEVRLADFTNSNFMTPGTVVVWTSIYFATSVIWLVISGLLLLDSYKSKFTSNIIIGWVAVSVVVVAIDFAGTVAFGVDFDRVKSEIDNRPIPFGAEILLAPAFMMTMCARGFILWIMNVGLVIYLGVAGSKLYKDPFRHYV